MDGRLLVATVDDRPDGLEGPAVSGWVDAVTPKALNICAVRLLVAMSLEMRMFQMSSVR